MKTLAGMKLRRRLRALLRPARSDPDVQADANPLRAHRCVAGRVERWHPVAAVGEPSRPAEDAGALADGIFQPPGFVAVGGSVFDLRAEGVYRFYRLPRLSEQRIVWHGEPDRLLSMLGYLWRYGNADDAMGTEDALAALRRRFVVATCGPLARLAAAVLDAGAVAVRRVALISLDRWGGQDDGHTLVEVRAPDSDWFVYDPSFNRCIVEEGRGLSLMDAVEALRRRRASLERLAGNPGYGSFHAHGFDYGFWVDERLQSEAILYDWYRRMADLPLIDDGGTFAFPADGLAADDRDRLSRRYRPLPREAFMARFYAGDDPRRPTSPGGALDPGGRRPA